MSEGGPEADRVRDDLQALLTDGKATAATHFVLWVGANTRGRPDQARLHWEQAFKLDPGMPVVTFVVCPDPLSRRVLRVSMGSVLRVPVVKAEDLADVVDRLRDAHGFVTAATVVDPGSEPLDTFRRPDRLALFLGSKGHGLEPEWLALCNRRVSIPMRPGAESLNVAVAAGIALYHVTRR